MQKYQKAKDILNFQFYPIVFSKVDNCLHAKNQIKT